MTTTRTATAEKIINRAATELGLASVADPFASDDPNFIQLVALLNAVGEELCSAYQWEFLTQSHQIVTSSLDSGDYDLPTDFLYMIPQTGWERTNNFPVSGPLSAQDWTYLLGRNLVSTTIYASFRIQAGLFSIFPRPVVDGLDINFEYQSKNWVIDNTTPPGVYTDECLQASDTVLFDKNLATRYLKVKYLEAKGLDATAATDDFTQVFSFLTNIEKGVGEIISAGSRRRGFPYLDYRNLPDSNYGL